MIKQISNRGRNITVEAIPWYDEYEFWEHCYVERDWEADTHIVLDQNLTPETVLIDVGAWIGPFVLYGSPLCKTIIALEPDPIAAGILEKNIFYNNIENVILHRKALWNGSDVTLGVKDSGEMGDSMTSVLYATSSNTITVPSTTFEELIDQHSIDPENIFIKIDIEGAESDALLMNIGFIKSYHPPIWLSLHLPLVDNKKEYIDKIQQIVSLYNFKKPVPTGYESLLLC